MAVSIPRLRGVGSQKSASCTSAFVPNAKLRKDNRSSKASRNQSAQQSYRAGNKEPWLLATNLPQNDKLYSK